MVGTIISIVSLAAAFFSLLSQLIFLKKEGKDERAAKIRSHSNGVTFSIVMMTLCVLIGLGIFIDFSVETYRMMLLGVLIITNITYAVTLEYYKRQY
ncbi:hypothetical protein [Paenibacillus mendelii]|uniref:DUF2178 domain-containing protein n=1 Tax=Paenibacillus mendelii TaxID=206163 RepID=A0ABV6JC81_9BACL|nr:hypothetical protein [Paenibacillus mendelii]MCQ6561514.1 hypothetical protein [Paenibacillus mendelii]